MNKQAVINEEASGDVKGLQEQIQQLKVGIISTVLSKVVPANKLYEIYHLFRI